MIADKRKLFFPVLSTCNMPAVTKMCWHTPSSSPEHVCVTCGSKTSCDMIFLQLSQKLQCPYLSF